ncbi:hypothetical protein GYMC52_3089 [Geobacillus sp. Y412MC52]|nr:hypothetical protein GYMC52_3089 [Geobacillus sp. Y412MC52]
MLRKYYWVCFMDLAQECFLQAKNAEKCKKKYIGLPAQDLRLQTGGRGRLDRGESVPQSIALVKARMWAW